MVRNRGARMLRSKPIAYITALTLLAVAGVAIACKLKHGGPPPIPADAAMCTDVCKLVPSDDPPPSAEPVALAEAPPVPEEKKADDEPVKVKAEEVPPPPAGEALPPTPVTPRPLSAPPRLRPGPSLFGRLPRRSRTLRRLRKPVYRPSRTSPRPR